MKRLVLIISLFSAYPIFGQHLRLDSLVQHNYSYAPDSYVKTYSYISDRDFTIYIRKFNGELATSFYKDSLLVRSFSDNLINEYQYDSLRREIYSSVNFMNSSTIENRKSYWKDTNLLTMQEETFLYNKDTVKYMIRHFTLDDQSRFLTSEDRALDELGKEHRSNSTTEYEDDSLSIQEMNIYNEGKGWDRTTMYTQYYPKIFYGDTVCTTYSQWNPDTQTKESTRCTKYEWGKPGSLADWGYIAYRFDNIYGKINDYSETDHGYMWTGYVCQSEKGPDDWREDLKSRFQTTGTRCITLNEYGLPAVDESFDATGVLQNRTEYYYKDADDYSIKPLPEYTNCQIIRELNPDTIYYDVYGRRVKDASNTQFLFEADSNGMKRVLFVME